MSDPIVDDLQANLQDRLEITEETAAAGEELAATEEFANTLNYPAPAEKSQALPVAAQEKEGIAKESQVLPTDSKDKKGEPAVTEETIPVKEIEPKDLEGLVVQTTETSIVANGSLQEQPLKGFIEVSAFDEKEVVASIEDEGGLVLLPENAPNFPVKTHHFSLDSDVTGKRRTDVIITHFADRDQVVITDTGKAGTVFQVRKDRPRSSALATSGSGSDYIFSVDLLLGVESEELVLFGRLLATSLKAARPLTLALGFKDIEASLGDPQSLKPLLDAVTSSWLNSGK